LRTKRSEVIEHILRTAQEAAPNSVRFNSEIQKQFGMSRQQVVRYVQELCQEGKLKQISSGRGAAYIWQGITSTHASVPLDHRSDLRKAQFDKLQSAIQFIKPALKPNQAGALHVLTKDLLSSFASFWPDQISLLSFSEEFPSIIVQYSTDADGIFGMVQRKFKLPSLMDAIAAVAKSIDSQPGLASIFEILSTADFATIESDGIIWEYSPRAMDWSMRRTDRLRSGTLIRLEIERNNSRFLNRVATIHQENGSQNSTCLLMVATVAVNKKRARSRSEAQQLLQNTEMFSKLIVDFRHVERIGLGFLDEIFVRQQMRRPELTIEHRNMNDIMRHLLERATETLRKTQGKVKKSLES
jgi:hypothetical protein